MWSMRARRPRRPWRSPGAATACAWRSSAASAARRRPGNRAPPKTICSTSPSLVGRRRRVATSRARAAAGRPSSVGRFTLLQRLGVGAMGVVYAAYDPELDRRIAVKLLRTRQGPGAARAQARLLREAQAMARLAHPHVAVVHNVGTHEGDVFVAMEFVRGATLQGWLKQQTRSWREVVDVFMQAGRGLAAAHAAGLVHRDFKPSNAMIGDDGRVRVLDFGLCYTQTAADHDEVDETGGVRGSGAGALRASGAGTLRSSGIGSGAVSTSGAGVRTNVRITRREEVVGTPAYMPPEQFRTDGIVGPASDQFSFCASLYEALYGQLPFAGQTVPEVALSIARGDLRPPPRASRVPRMVARDRATRPQDRPAAALPVDGPAAASPRARPGPGAGRCGDRRLPRDRHRPRRVLGRPQPGRRPVQRRRHADGRRVGPRATHQRRAGARRRRPGLRRGAVAPRLLGDRSLRRRLAGRPPRGLPGPPARRELRLPPRPPHGLPRSNARPPCARPSTCSPRARPRSPCTPSRSSTASRPSTAAATSPRSRPMSDRRATRRARRGRAATPATGPRTHRSSTPDCRQPPSPSPTRCSPPPSRSATASCSPRPCCSAVAWRSIASARRRVRTPC